MKFAAGEYPAGLSTSERLGIISSRRLYLSLAACSRARFPQEFRLSIFHGGGGTTMLDVPREEESLLDGRLQLTDTYRGNYAGEIDAERSEDKETGANQREAKPRDGRKSFVYKRASRRFYLRQ